MEKNNEKTRTQKNSSDDISLIYKATLSTIYMSKIHMKTRKKTTQYIAYTSIGFWPFSTPRASPVKAIIAAENQVSTALLKSRGTSFPTEFFGSWLRANHPDIVAESHDYIGEVRQVSLLDGETPREFRRRYCSICHQEDMEMR